MTARTRPNLPELLAVLRNRRRWPKGFEWNYANFCGCAIELSRRRWGLDWRRIWSAQLSEDFNIPERAVRRIFYDADREVGKTEREDVTPEDVAGVVEAVMAGGSAAEASNAG